MKAIFSILDEHIAEADKQSRAELADNQMDAVRQWRAVASTLKALRSEIADAVEPPMPRGLREWIEGMTVSVDVSTSEDDADHRYYGTVTEVMDAPDDKHGVTLLVQDAKPNFTAQAPAPAPEPEPTLKELGEELHAAGHDLFYALRREGAGGCAVRWVSYDDGTVIIFTRGEYRDRIMAAVDDIGQPIWQWTEEGEFKAGERESQAPAVGALTNEQIAEHLPMPAYHDGFGRSPDLWTLEQIGEGVRAALAHPPVQGSGK